MAGTVGNVAHKKTASKMRFMLTGGKITGC